MIDDKEIDSQARKLLADLQEPPHSLGSEDDLEQWRLRTIRKALAKAYNCGSYDGAEYERNR